MKIIYITHCSAKKNDKFKNKNIRVIPDRLYISKRLQRFIKKCKAENVNWAIFSDKYSIVFPKNKIKWYDKHPSKVTDEEFKILIKKALMRLKKYNKIYFYYHPARFNKRYRKVVNKLRKNNLKIILIKYLKNIKKRHINSHLQV